MCDERGNDQRLGQDRVRSASWAGVSVCGPVSHLRRMVGQACRIAPAVGDAETARAVWLCLGEWLHRAAVALALIQTDQRTVLAGQYRIERVERAALDHREAADGDADADRCRLFRRNAAGEQQQQDQRGSHSDSMRLPGKSMVCICVCGAAGASLWSAAPAERQQRRIVWEPTWSTYSTRSMRNYAPNAPSNC